ncbi:TPA: hypothetical protein ACOEF8_004751, partial [Enterobacter roggenkampii]
MALNLINKNKNDNFVADFARSDIKKITIADVDLVVELKNGVFFVLVSAAIDAMDGNEEFLIFNSGSKVSLKELIQLVDNFSLENIPSPLGESLVAAVEPEKDKKNVEEDVKDVLEEGESSSDKSDGETQTSQGNLSSPPQNHDSSALSQAINSFSQHKKANLISESITQDLSEKLSLPPNSFTGEGKKNSTDIFDHKPMANLSGPLMYNVTGVRYESNIIYGGGGCSGSDIDGGAIAQSAPEYIYGTKQDDVIFADDASRLGNGFAKILSFRVSNVSRIESYTISGLPDYFTLDGGANNNGVWSAINYPLSNNGVVTLSNTLKYPSSDDDAFSDNSLFDLVVNIRAIDIYGFPVEFKRAGVAVIKDVYSANDLLLSSSSGDFAIVLPANGVSNYIYGDAGNDIIYGGLNKDTLDGGAGADRLAG